MATLSQLVNATGAVPLVKRVTDTMATIAVTGTAAGVAPTNAGLQFAFQGSVDGKNFGNIVAQNMTTGAVQTGTISATDSTVQIWRVPCDGLSAIQMNVTQLTSGSFTLSMLTEALVGVVTGISTTSAAITTALTSTSANALAVGPNGVTNPTLNVDGSVTSEATGLNIKGAASGNGVALQALTSGTNEVLTIDAAAAALVKIGTIASTALGLQVGSSTSAAGTQLIVQSVSAAALTMGRLGATTPAFVVDASTATCITGVKIKAGATTTGVAISAVGEASNGALKIDAQGSGAIILGDTSTGPLYIGRGSLLAPQIGLTQTALGTVQSSTPTSAQLLGGLVTQSGTTGGGTVTLPTGTALSTACNRTPASGDSFTCNFCSITGGQTLTLTGATGTAIRGSAAVAAGKNATMLFVCTGANTWDVFCNVSA
jgi:hypothetical protein